MAHPRPALKGVVYFVNRRCARRQFLMRPSKRVNQAVRYCLAEAAAHPDNNVELLWFFTMSNHLHYAIYDPDGTYPVFLARFHKLLAKVLNRHFGRRGNLFEAEQTSVIELCDADAVFEKMIYSLTNAVKDHLVARADEWPGFSSLRAQLADEEIVEKRPDWFFAKDTKMPAEVRLRFRRPPQFEHLSQRDWADMINKAIRRRERQALEERRAEGRRVMGPGAIRAQSAFDFPATSEEPRTINPTVAAKDPQVRAAAIARRKAWRAAYSAALAAHRAGTPDVVFPAGTYKLWHERHVARHPEP